SRPGGALAGAPGSRRRFRGSRPGSTDCPPAPRSAEHPRGVSARCPDRRPTPSARRSLTCHALWSWYPLAFDSSLGRDSVVIAFSANRPRDLEQLLEDAQQRRRADRLAQELHRSGRPCPPLLVVAGPAGEEYDRDWHAALGEATLDLQAVHARHADVQHEACGSRRGSGGKTLFPGGERLCAISEGP